MRAMSLALVVVAVGSACAPVASAPEGSTTPSPPSPSSPSPDTFVVPTPEPETSAPDVLPSASFSYPEIASEVQKVFERVYAARTLRPGGQFDVAALRGLVAGVYADYTLPLFDRELRNAKAGVLRQVTFTNISVELDTWLLVTRSTGAEPPQVGTYEFRVHRHSADNWLAVDFFRPDVNRWVTDLAGATVIVPPLGHG